MNNVVKSGGKWVVTDNCGKKIGSYKQKANAVKARIAFEKGEEKKDEKG